MASKRIIKSLVMCVSSIQEIHIPSDLCSPTQDTHIPSNMSSLKQETHIPSELCSPTRETHIPSKTHNISDVCSPYQGNT